MNWVKTSMITGKERNMEFSKLLFMGFVPANERISLIDAYIKDLEQEKIDDIVHFELITLQLGIDKTSFEIQWFKQYKDKMKGQ